MKLDIFFITRFLIHPCFFAPYSEYNITYHLRVQVADIVLGAANAELDRETRILVSP